MRKHMFTIEELYIYLYLYLSVKFRTRDTTSHKSVFLLHRLPSS